MRIEKMNARVAAQPLGYLEGGDMRLEGSERATDPEQRNKSDYMLIAYHDGEQSHAYTKLVPVKVVR